MPRKKKVITAETIITRKKSAKKKSPAKKLTALAAAKPKRKPRIKKTVAPIVLANQERIEESKYYAGPVMQKFAPEKGFEFPASYGDNRIVAMVRDPAWFFAYWEVSRQRRDEIRQMVGHDQFARSRETLRVYDTENWNYFDIHLAGGATSWYIKVAPNRTYCVDIGFLLPDGRFIAAARSNWISMPLDRMSDVIDEEWLTLDWDKLYALSGGFGLGKGSQEIRELVKKRFLEESASGWVSSGSAQAPRPARPFWLAANCELIVYGATEPSATVTIQGRKIELRDDGTFSLRFSLPDGNQVIPIEAVRDDGAERRQITPKVERRTE